MARRLLLLNGLAIVGVILNHSAAWVFIAMFWWTDRYAQVPGVPDFGQLGGFNYYILRVVEQLVAYSVPAFLFVSGFFVAFAAGKSTPREAWRLAISRITTLAIPFVLWSMLIFAIEFLQGTTRTLGGYLMALVTGGAAPAYYFIPLLFQYYLVAPLFLMASRTHWRPLLAGAALMQLTVQVVYYLSILGIEGTTIRLAISLTPSWFFPNKVFWFVLGIVISMKLRDVGPWLNRRKWLVLISLTILLLLGVLEWEVLLQASGREWIPYFDTALDGLYALAFILTFLAFSRNRLPFSTQLSAVGAKSYGIYLAHSPVLEYGSKLTYHVAPRLLGLPLVFFGVLCVLGLGVPLLMMAFVKRSPFRPYYHYVFG